MAWLKQHHRILTIELPATVLKEFNAKEWVKKAVDCGADVIVAFAYSYLGGLTFYKSKFAPPHPDMGDRDILRETVEECRKQGVKVIAYVNSIWGGEHEYKEHEDWCQRRYNGKIVEMGPSREMCLNSPHREYIINIVREILENYDVDGIFVDEPSFQSWCKCKYCEEKFKAETGLEIPKYAKWDNPKWIKFMEWRYKCITEAIEEIAKNVKSVKNDAICFFQFHFPISSFSWLWLSIVGGGKMEWRYGSEYEGFYIPRIYAEKLEDISKHEDVVSMELYRSFARQPVWWIGACIKYAKRFADNKPIFTLVETPFFPWSLYLRPSVELKATIGEIVANGGCPWFSIYGPGISDMRRLETIKEVFQKLKSCEEHLNNVDLLKYAAVLFSLQTVDYYAANDTEGRYLNHFLGFYRSMIENHIQVDVLSDKDISFDVLKEYKVVCLPNAACLSDLQIRELEKYVKSGGGLIATYETSLYDEKGVKRNNFGLADLFNIDYTGKTEDAGITYIRISNEHPVVDNISKGVLLPYFLNIPVSTPRSMDNVLAILVKPPETMFSPIGEDTKIPVILAQNYGEGRVVFIPGCLDAIYMLMEINDYCNILANAVRWAAKSPEPVEVKNCPRIVEVNSWEKKDGKRIIVHLVNHGHDTRPILGPISRLVNYAIPVYDVEIQVRKAVNEKVKKAYLAFHNKTLDYEVKDNLVKIVVPKVEDYEIVVIEFD